MRANGAGRSDRPRRAAQALATGILAATLSSAIPATVLAVRPPSIDPGALPPGNLPPPPSELRDPCTPTAEVVDPLAIPGPQRSLDLESVWPLSTGAGQLVAVIDTGVERHPRLRGLEAGGDFVAPGDGTSDCDAHGTLVAGIIAAGRSGSTGFAGVAPDARILTIRQSSNIYRQVGPQRDEDGKNATGVGSLDTLASAIRLAADRNASVINISLVACMPARAGEHRALSAAIDYAARVHDAVIVAAAGNRENDCSDGNPRLDPARPQADPWDDVVTVVTPAWFDDQVLTVGSVDPDGSPSDFTVPGPWVDVAAPGTAITSLDPRRLEDAGLTDATGRGPVQGTSFAAPYVAGTAALIRARHPELSAAQVMARIEATAHAPAGDWDPFVGHGVVDPLAALTSTGPATPAEPPSVAVAIPAPSPPPDNRPRTVALGGAAVVGTLLVIGLVASTPLASGRVADLRWGRSLSSRRRRRSTRSA
ncbi:type VII secretion-associated serine protease mycosin [Rhodococcus gannanensis]|uniref:Type VII secretion-associated serine protease mycosin n=1 Tax=Rhodococcus gannanensis TaxID=1960308 RepID=A0ABW4P931_9NOCA